MLLRRVIDHVRAQNWFAVGLDFVIVVVGVFIGIQMSNWNEARSNAAAETAMLQELRAALATDAEAIDAALTHYRQVDEQVGFLLKHMQEGEPYNATLDGDFGVLYGFGDVDFNRAVYKSLKSRGLDLISNDDLRSHIVQVYERSYRKAEGAVEAELRVILDVMRPYFLSQFKDLRFNASATPVDYDGLLEDIKFLNITDYRLQIVRQALIPRAEAAATDIRRLIAAIDRELGAGAPPGVAPIF